MKNKILFILKRREDYNPIEHSPVGLSTGLYNSASFMRNMLVNAGVDAEIEVAIDNNCIDRLVNLHKPTHVIVEALWVVPTKFAVLTKLHPTVKWIVRLHSELPFLAGEGIAFDWIAEYIKFNQISIGVNAPRMLEETRIYLATACGLTEKVADSRIVYMPNYYPQNYKTKQFEEPNKYRPHKYWIDVACFGAIRPLKNHMVQALAAVKYANHCGKQLRFHVNAGRIEMNGNPVLNNLKATFEQMSDYGYQLISHEWTPWDEFLEICSTMDVGLQANFSETFNIVSADLISQGVPIVGSREIPWSNWIFNARATESDEIFHAMSRACLFPKANVWLNQHNLTKYTNKTEKIWLKYFKEQENE